MSGSLLRPVSDSLLRRVAIVGQPAAAFWPDSLRRGGASWDFLQHGQIDRTLDRGRWQHAKTAKVYVQTAVAEAADLALSAQCEADLKYFAQYLLNI